MTHDKPLRGGVLASLRGLIPARRLRFSEALRIAELQAARLLELTGIDEAPVPSEVISALPRLRVAQRDLPASGLSYWDGQAWLICLNRREPRSRQRFTLCHEFKHIIDHGRQAALYSSTDPQQRVRQAEQAADYFAGCVLMPRRLLKRAWGAGVQRPAAVARQFAVSERAASVRLAQVGLTDEPPRCVPPPEPRRGRYYRQRRPVEQCEEQPA